MIRRPDLRLMIALAPPLVLGTIAVALAENTPRADWRFVLLFIAVGAVAAGSWRVGAEALGVRSRARTAYRIGWRCSREANGAGP